MRLCFATNNRHKLEEVSRLLPDRHTLITLKEIGCTEELPETTGTIHGNSKQKAEYVYKKFNINCFADDSGLEVTALENAPGVDSAIYAGSHRSHLDNINLLLRNLNGVRDRGAHFVTVITLIISGEVFQFEGVLNGKIIDAPRGNKGFGYDPIFVPEGFSKTLAELTMEEKNQISHRAIALQKVLGFLNSNLAS